VRTSDPTWRYIPEDSTLHNHRSENLKSYKLSGCQEGLCSMALLSYIAFTILREQDETEVWTSSVEQIFFREPSL
jgi:hypothetical protein